jgi:hypothetical protein
MCPAVDFESGSTAGLESSPVAPALAGLRANEARYFKNKYDHVFTVEPAAKAKKAIDWVPRQGLEVRVLGADRFRARWCHRQIADGLRPSGEGYARSASSATALDRRSRD